MTCFGRETVCLISICCHNCQRYFTVAAPFTQRLMKTLTFPHRFCLRRCINLNAIRKVRPSQWSETPNLLHISVKRRLRCEFECGIIHLSGNIQHKLAKQITLMMFYFWFSEWDLSELLMHLWCASSRFERTLKALHFTHSQTHTHTPHQDPHTSLGSNLGFSIFPRSLQHVDRRGQGLNRQRSD